MSNLYASILNKEIDAIQDLLPQLSSRLSWSKEEVKVEQQRALVALLAYAKANSPYYARKFARIEPSHFTLGDLAKLPTMNKKEVMEHWDEIVTDRNLTLERASQFLHHQVEPELLDNSYHFTATGGSSGIRGLFGWNIEEFILFVATFFVSNIAMSFLCIKIIALYSWQRLLQRSQFILVDLYLRFLSCHK
ncbi:hypothetical protein [Legionella tunisiensis]|uniref:hypothetical protein n=1 Tax=Legionella tunisiensis TaxID=1034944 RepID=UPI0002D95D35|nr:hypothetical protein [Legionella tunisiensis]